MSRIPVVEHYNFQSLIGSGTFGEVYKGVRNEDQVVVAAKIVKNSKLKTPKLKESLEKEISIMKATKHPNIVNLFDVIKQNDETILIMEFCEGGDLAEFLEKRGRLKEDLVKNFIVQIAAALEFLRYHKIIHRDIKPKNILLTDKTDQAILKLADFGFARFIDSNFLAETACGTPLYMAPEISQGKKYDMKVDLWSVGCIFYEMIIGKRPFDASTQVELHEKIKNNPVTFPSNVKISDSCKDIILKLLQKDKSLRISHEEFFLHPFVNLKSYTRPLPNAQERMELHKSKISFQNTLSAETTTQEIIASLNQFVLTGEYEVVEKNQDTEGESDYVELDRDQVLISQIADETKATLKEAMESTKRLIKDPLDESIDSAIERILSRYFNPKYDHEIDEIQFDLQKLRAILKLGEYIRSDEYQNSEYFKSKEESEMDSFCIFSLCIKVSRGIINKLEEIFVRNEKIPKLLSNAPSFLSQTLKTCTAIINSLNCNKKVTDFGMSLRQSKILVNRARTVAKEGSYEEETNIDLSLLCYIEAILLFETILKNITEVLQGDDEKKIKDQIVLIAVRLQKTSQ